MFFSVLHNHIYRSLTLFFQLLRCLFFCKFVKVNFYIPFIYILSTVSSSVNSLTAVFLMDFVQPIMAKAGRPMEEKKEHIYAKVIGMIFK